VNYHHTLDYLKVLEEEGVALVLRPPVPIQMERAEKNREKIRGTYLMGYNYGQEIMSQIKSFVESPVTKIIEQV
jgi:predicted patatin/cPLA2 family phospholipase